MFYSKKKAHYYVGQEIPIQQKDQYRFLDKRVAVALKMSHGRMMFLAFVSLVFFMVLAGRLFEQTILKYDPKNVRKSFVMTPIKRANIVDRTGTLVASSLPIVDLYIDAREIKNPQQMDEDLRGVFPDLNSEALLRIFQSGNAFKYLKRNITPEEQKRVNNLGYPQLNFLDSERRVYPQSSLFSHVLGFTDIDNQGISGLEKALDKELTEQQKPIQISLDIGIQNIVHHALKNALETFSAPAGAAVVMNAQNGEIIALVSLPDFDPNQFPMPVEKLTMNQATTGVYELGSVMKVLNAAMGLESGVVSPDDKIDATKSFKIGNRWIKDYKGKERFLTLAEVLIYSSNIGSARVALAAGAQNQRAFLDRLNMLVPLHYELPEKSHPIIPKQWNEIQTATIGYGYGLAVSPLHIVSAIAAIVNGGYYHYPTFIKGGNDAQPTTQVLSKQTSKIMRHMMRAIVEVGYGKKADVSGYLVGGKTGSAQLLDERGRYIKGTIRTSFVSAFPMDNPQFVVYVMLENPKGRQEDWYYNDAGWNACPTAGMIIEGIAPLLGVEPREEMARPAYIEMAYDALKNKE